MSKAYFSGGCFWCIADYFISLHIDGVKDVIVGYCGGEEKYATYEMVKSQKTKHRETIEIEYDEKKISLEKLLEIFADYVDVHDGEGQFIDRGFSYTLALFYEKKSQKALFDSFIKTLDDPVFISVEPFKFFVKAEEYHQHYGSKNPSKMMDEIITSGRTCHLKIKHGK